MTDKGLIYYAYRKLIQLNIKKTHIKKNTQNRRTQTQPTKKLAEKPNRHFPCIFKGNADGG